MHRLATFTLPALILLPAATPAASSHAFVDGGVRLTYPASLTPGHAFPGGSLMAGGWRLMWDGTPPGAGQGVVRFQLLARPREGIGQVTESVQIGRSRDRRVVATCGTAGTKGPDATRLLNRMLGGHRWTVWTNGDAGMSQAVSATDWRTVVGGTCYAIDRVRYSVKAATPLPRTAPSEATATARIDAILASVRVS